MGIFSKKELNKDSKVLFLVTSAVNTLWGKSELIRFTETIATINSINANFNNAEIWLLESGVREINKNLIKELPKNVILKSFSKDPNILKFIKESIVYSLTFIEKWKVSNASYKDSLKLTFLKNRTESYVFKEILTKNNLKGFDRIFKVSGRYSLSPNFNIEQHSVKDKYVFIKSINSNQTHVPIDKIYPCFCWSFNEILLDDTIKMFIDLEKIIEEMFNKVGYIDIEHLLYNKLNKDSVKEVSKMGIFANIGEKGYVFI